MHSSPDLQSGRSLCWSPHGSTVVSEVAALITHGLIGRLPTLMNSCKHQTSQREQSSIAQSLSDAGMGLAGHTGCVADTAAGRQQALLPAGALPSAPHTKPCLQSCFQPLLRPASQPLRAAV